MQEFRDRDHHVAALAARLLSLEELDAARADYGDGARLVLAESNGDVGQMGSVADYLEVDGRYERAVEACLGDLLQHVVVPTHEEAAAGLRFASERNAGRVGFLVAANPPLSAAEIPVPALVGLTAMTEIVRVSGPAQQAIATTLADAWLAETPESARTAAAIVRGAIATLDGQVFRGPNVVQGGMRAESRGILGTKREIKELRDRIDSERAVVARLRDEIGGLDVAVAAAESSIASVQAELHRQEKAVVGFELQLTSAADAANRVARKNDQIAIERRSADEELSAQEERQDEARTSIARIAIEQQSADDRLNQAQRRLFEAREAVQAQARRTSEAKATHAGLVERTAALASEVQRLQDAASSRRASSAGARSCAAPKRGASSCAKASLPPRRSSTPDCASSTTSASA
jgi:chromosome segregation protein